MKKILLLIMISLSMAGCSIIHSYRPDVQQGNVINPQQVAKLRLGMTKTQVVDLMGDPVVQNVFADNRLEYVYTYWPNYGKTRRQAVILTFQKDHLVNINKQLSPPGQATR